jgi:lipopolysaccharide/colanic/teichoic acid biosynthesis glycosyltransferase
MRIFSVILPVRVSGLLFSEFLFILSCYLAATLVVFQKKTGCYLTEDNGIASLLIVTASMLLGLFVNNLYAATRLESRIVLVLKLCNVAGIALIVQGLLSYVSSGLSLPREVMIGGTLLSFLCLLLWRLFYGGVFLKMIGAQNVLFIGTDVVLEEIAARMHDRPELGFHVCGFLADPADFDLSANTALGDCLGPLTDLPGAAGRLKVNRIIVGLKDRRQNLAIADLLQLSRKGILIEEAATAYESVCGRVCSRKLRPSQVIFRNELAIRPGSMALQSVYSNLLALSAIIVTSPLMILLAVAVKVTSRGPIIEEDVRLGQHGIPFNLNRFRCHRVAEGSTAESIEARLTPAGKWLRKLHLANLPMLFNLLRGEITLVGPRPERPEFAEELSQFFAFYRQRHSVKPGMTGWSQINTPAERRTDSLIQLEYDLYYTKHISLALDAYILLHNVRKILPFAQR